MSEISETLLISSQDRYNRAEMNTELPTPTPTAATENVLGRRIVAAFIDIAILAVVGIIFTIFFGETETSDNGFNFSLSGTPFLIYSLVVLAYYAGLEALTATTPGKSIMGLKVVALDGAYTPMRVLVRNLLRIIDGLPVFYLVGLICAGVTPRNQRIGDLAARTTFVRR